MRVLRPCCVLIFALAAVGCGAAKTPPETSPTAPGGASAAGDRAAFAAGGAGSTVRTHTVQRGDTLWSLSRRYGVSVDDIVGANGLTDPDSLTVGERLIVPAPATAGMWQWPVSGGEIVSRFGNRGSGVHRGLDIRAYDRQRVVAAWPGVVTYSGSGMRDYGRVVIVDHGGGLTSLYAHNSQLLVRVGDEVAGGQPIALAGKSGNATGVHCHFEVRQNAVALDPLEFFASASR